MPTRLAIYSLLVLLVFLLVPTRADAQLRICNKFGKDVHVAIAEPKGTPAKWVSNGWWVVKPDDCVRVIEDPLKNRYYYWYAYREGASREDLHYWGGGLEATGREFCARRRRMDDVSKEDCGEKERLPKFRRVDTGSTVTSFDVVIKDEGSALYRRAPPAFTASVSTDVVQEKCLAVWDDSHQVHSVDPILEWNYQALKTTMKKLRHCIKLRMTGPVSMSGVAEAYVKDCVNFALNDNRNRYILQGLVALGIDILSAGTTGGGATAAAVTTYVNAVADKTSTCLTDQKRVEAFVGERLKATFNATVNKESEWIYWEL